MRKAAEIILAGMLAIGLTACANAVEVPAVKTTGIAEPIVSTENFETILKQAKENLEKADKTLDSTQLGVRIGGVTKFQREAQYRLKKILGDNYPLAAVVIDPKAVPISAGTEFPRVAASVNQPTEKQNFQTMSIWVQESARAAYTLWGQTYLFPDLKIPKLKSNLTDVKTIRKAEKYLTDPAQLLNSYTAYLNSGEQKEPKFNESDPIFTQIKEQREQLKNALGQLAAVQTGAAVGDKGFQLVPAEGGGAILTGEIKYNVVVERSDENATLRLKGEIGALASGSADQPQVDVKKKLTASYTLLAAFYLPPKDTSKKQQNQTVEVIGATAPTLVSVTNE